MPLKYSIQNRQVGASTVAGFTLIEVLISIIVLSVGLLGIAMMQANGMNFTTSAYARTQASFLANEILDAMRMSATPGNYTGTPGTCTTLSIPATISDSNNLACWYAQIQNTKVLPAGGACITNSSGTTYTVEVYWTRLRTHDTSAPTATICGTSKSDTDSIKIEAVL